MAPTISASSSSGGASVGCSTSRSQGIIEPMDTETQEHGRTSADRRTEGQKNTQMDAKMRADGRTQGDRSQVAQRTQADRKAQVDVVTQDSERLQLDRNSEKDVVAQRRVETQVERTQADERMRKDRKAQAGGTIQEDTRMQEERGTWSEDSIPAAVKNQSENWSVTSLSPPSRAPKPPPSEHSRSSQITEYIAQTPETSCIQEKPGIMVRSEEPAVTSSMNHQDTVLDPLLGNLGHPAQPPTGNLEQVGEERCQGQEWSGLVKAKPEDGQLQCPKEQWPGDVLCVDLGGPSQEVSTMPSLPGTEEGLHSTLTSQHLSTSACLSSGDQALLSSAPTLNLGPRSATQSHPAEAMATSGEGACAKEPDMEGRPPCTRSCDPGLIDSLKNYLLLLLKLSNTQASEAGAESQVGTATGGLEPSSTLAPTVEVAGLSPRTSRRILERVENNHLVQSAQTLLLSPCTSRRLTGLLDREVQAGQQALAAAQGFQAPSPLTVPTIVVGEEGSGLPSEGFSVHEREVSLEGPGLWGASQESGMGGPLGEGGRQIAESKTQEPFPEEEVPGEALTGLPAATPEELALGARRKIFLPKVRAAGDGEVAKPEERESPSVSPRGSRKSLAPGSPGTPGRERRSPTQGRKVGMLEVPRAEEEPTAEDLGSSPKASGLDTEPALDEGKQEALAKSKKAKDLLKGEQWKGWKKSSKKLQRGTAT